MAMVKGGGEGADSAPRRGRPRSIETTNAILQSAYALMATTGLAATTIDAVARRSSVSKMTIYKWWPSREALLIDAFLQHAARMLPLPPASSGSAAARARRHAAAYAEALPRASSARSSSPSSPNAFPRPALPSCSTPAICNSAATPWSR
ncbi:AcrR family transcriptional regulator [Bradyrhizobium sp. LM3.2]